MFVGEVGCCISRILHTAPTLYNVKFVKDWLKDRFLNGSMNLMNWTVYFPSSWSTAVLFPVVDASWWAGHQPGLSRHSRHLWLRLEPPQWHPGTETMCPRPLTLHSLCLFLLCSSNTHRCAKVNVCTHNGIIVIIWNNTTKCSVFLSLCIWSSHFGVWVCYVISPP